MGIALGYAFLVAIAGGLAAICFVWFMELAEDGQQPAEGEPGEGSRPFPSFGTPPVVPRVHHMAGLRRIGDAPSRPAPPHLPLTPK